MFLFVKSMTRYSLSIVTELPRQVPIGMHVGKIFRHIPKHITGEGRHMFYRHFKGKYYQTVAEALDTSSDDTVVIYRTLYPSDYEWFTRPKAEFHGEKILESGLTVRRFAPTDFSDLPDEVQEYVNSHPVPSFSSF